MRLALACVLAVLGVTSAWAVEDYGTPPNPNRVVGQWQPAGYAVTWAAPEPACLVINQQLLGDVPCATTGQVVLARAGGDWHTAAIPGRTLTLVAATAITQPLVSVVIPEEARRVALPVVLVGQ